MTQGFFQFNNSIINEILNFTTSHFDLLYMSGPKGSGKSETINKTIPELAENNLIFQHFCFENSVIDDFLMNFYDALKNFAGLNKISLKKFDAESFEEKIKHYFKVIEQSCILIVENFEKIKDNTEISDFLAYLGRYDNIKIIVISRSKDENPFLNKNIMVQSLETEQINKSDFKSKFAVLAETTNDELKEKFYNITSGLELYLNMGVKYCSITGTEPRELIGEFERKNISIYTDFEEFIVSKFVSLTPSAYLNLFRFLSVMSHPVSQNFIEEYKLGNIAWVEYLVKNFLLSKFKEEIYVKDYFKQYVIKTFSIQEKISHYKNLINIYEKELQKSPKDRLIRLSRESIRKEIERLKLLTPTINSPENEKKAFTYLGITNKSWHDERLNQKTKLSEKLNKIKERKNFLSKEKTMTFIPKKPSEAEALNSEFKEEDRRFIISLINSSREYSRKYEYNNAIAELKRAQEVDSDCEFEIEILLLIAKNYEYLNEFNIAQKYYNSALNNAIESNDSRKTQIKFSIAFCNKNMYKTELAQKQFFEIASNENNMYTYRSKSLIEAGEIEQANNNNEKAIECYETALALSLGKNKELVCRAYYRLAVLYDEIQDWENALKYYQKNYTTSSLRRENKYYSASITNIALIYYEQNKIKDSIEYLKMALQYDSEINDIENMYFSQKELAKIYANFDDVSAIGYYKQALDSAQKLNDDLKIANVYFEAGEFYYDRLDDKKALINFFSAKRVLKNMTKNDSVLRIESRIKDIKVRLDEKNYNLIAQEYDK